jgi:peptidyl-prolyl cis-trans isomerase B (cyclophilin B)
VRFPAEPPLTVVAGSAYTAALATNCGNVTLALDAAHAPHTVNSFVFLAGQRYFDHSPCHRLTTAGIYVLQCGDPTGTGTGGPGYTIPDENLSGATYPAGTVAMANTGRPHSGGSQFFLVYRDTQLPPSYTPFARISAGLDVLQAIAAMGTTSGGPDGPPKANVVIDAVTSTRA